MDSRKSESEDDLSLDLSFSSSDYDIEDSDNDNEVLGIQPYMFEPYSNEAPPGNQTMHKITKQRIHDYNHYNGNIPIMIQIKSILHIIYIFDHIYFTKSNKFD